jgi:putative restriction endonuclease
VDEEELFQRLRSFRQWQAGDQRAPHKPLLLLLALGNVQRGGERLQAFNDLEEPLARLLAEFGPPRRNQQPRYPFWRLQADELWEVVGQPELAVHPRNSDPALALLRQQETRGGLPPHLDGQLRANPEWLERAAQLLLDDHFPPSVHEDIALAVGLQLGAATARGRPGRDPQFRLEVLRAYEYTCAVCGYDGQLETVSVGVEAAHVRWWAHRGPDTLDNALALCALHHRAFDRGVISLDEDYTVMISSLFRGGPGARSMVTNFHGRPLRRPQPGAAVPDREHLGWHHREVFKAPARMIAAAAEEPLGYREE